MNKEMTMHINCLMQKYILKFDVSIYSVFLHFTIYFYARIHAYHSYFYCSACRWNIHREITFTAKSQSEKSGLEERINGLLGQIEQLKIQFQTERNQFENRFPTFI